MATVSCVKRVIVRCVPSGKGNAGLRALVALILILLGNGRVEAGLPTVSRLVTTDVTPGSFAVSWLASEPATAALNLFQSDCATPVVPPMVTFEGNDATGFLRMTVSGLAANTVYCYQTATTSKSTNETTVFPLQPLSLTTAAAVVRVTTVGGVNVPFANDLLRVPSVYLPTPTDTQDGVLVLLSLADGTGAAPLSRLLTADPTTGYFNMNNLFGTTTGTSLNLSGGERVKITESHGKSGCIIERFRTVPIDNETTRAAEFLPPTRPQDIDANGKVNILDILRVAAGVGSAQGTPCFNSELDLNKDSRVDTLDVQIVEGNFDATP
jgi:hypothetical protein